MSEAAKEHMRKRKRWASICQQLQDQKGMLSNEEELDLLYKKKGLIESILNHLQKEKRILKEDIASWEYDKVKNEGKILRRMAPSFIDVSSDEEREGEESESENSPDEDKKYVSLCARDSEEEDSEEEDSEEEDSNSS